jgi:transposase-like protein
LTTKQRRTYTPAERTRLIAKITKALAAGKSVEEACKTAGVSTNFYYNYKTRTPQKTVHNLADLPTKQRATTRRQHRRTSNDDAKLDLLLDLIKDILRKR